MFNRRILLSLAVLVSLVVADGLALAKNEHHNNGHNLLGPTVSALGTGLSASAIAPVRATGGLSGSRIK